MAESVKIVAKGRTETGSAASGRLRRSGTVPAVMCRRGGESTLLQLDRHEFELILLHNGRENLIADLEVDGNKPVKAILKELQEDPVHGDLLHVDFVEISMTEKMRVKIPIELIGEAVGVLKEGGVLDHVLREVEVECLPTDLVDALSVNIESMGIGDTIHASDLDVGEGLEVLTPMDMAIASVAAPMKEEEEEPEAEEGAEEGAEPEVIGEKKEDEEETAEEEGGKKSGNEDDK